VTRLPFAAAVILIAALAPSAAAQPVPLPSVPAPPAPLAVEFTPPAPFSPAPPALGPSAPSVPHVPAPFMAAVAHPVPAPTPPAPFMTAIAQPVPAFMPPAFTPPAQDSAAWQDPSPHHVQMVKADKRVQLEVLDWGGSGRPVVLLAGLGLTAHVFDGFAPKLAGSYHVYGITRRGYGASSRPATGYEADRLADDVLAVLDALQLTAPVLVGHSVAGEELSSLGARHPDRIAGLVYLDAAADRTARLDPKLEEITRKLSAAVPDGPSPTASDRKSFPAMQEYLQRVFGNALPEAEVRAEYAATAQGGVGAYRLPPWLGEAIKSGVQKPDYAHIQAPALAIYAIPQSARDLTPAWVTGENPAMLAALNEEYPLLLAARKEQMTEFQNGVAHSRVVELAGANHYIFLSNEADVLRELREFLGGLR
jgi:non-heme chloroperoxidase